MTLDPDGSWNSREPELILVSKEAWDDAMALEKWIADLKDNGNKLYVQGRNGALHEVHVKRPGMRN